MRVFHFLNYLRLCKRHFSNMILNTLRKEIRNLYRGADKAYSALDFQGVGSITEDDFLNSMIISKVPFSLEELKDFFYLTNMFKGRMNFDSFKKTFFPHLYLIKDGEESEEEKRDTEIK